MDEEIEKDNSLNPTGEETVEKETSVGEQETPKEPEIATSEKEEKKGEIRQDIYERMKKAEKEAKLAKEELEKIKKRSSNISTDVFDLAKTVSTLKEYNSKELDFIQKMSKMNDISPQEAAETEEAKLYIAALREKVAKESKTPEPSTKQSLSKKPVDKITPEEVSRMSQEEKEDYLIKTGWMIPPRKWPRG